MCVAARRRARENSTAEGSCLGASPSHPRRRCDARVRIIEMRRVGDASWRPHVRSRRVRRSSVREAISRTREHRSLASGKSLLYERARAEL